MDELTKALKKAVKQASEDDALAILGQLALNLKREALENELQPDHKLGVVRTDS